MEEKDIKDLSFEERLPGLKIWFASWKADASGLTTPLPLTNAP